MITVINFGVVPLGEPHELDVETLDLAASVARAYAAAQRESEAP